MRTSSEFWKERSPIGFLKNISLEEQKAWGQNRVCILSSVQWIINESCARALNFEKKGLLSVFQKIFLTKNRTRKVRTVFAYSHLNTCRPMRERVLSFILEIVLLLPRVSFARIINSAKRYSFVKGPQKKCKTSTECFKKRCLMSHFSAESREIPTKLRKKWIIIRNWKMICEISSFSYFEEVQERVLDSKIGRS